MLRFPCLLPNGNPSFVCGSSPSPRCCVGQGTKTITFHHLCVPTSLQETNNTTPHSHVSNSKGSAYENLSPPLGFFFKYKFRTTPLFQSFKKFLTIDKRWGRALDKNLRTQDLHQCSHSVLRQERRRSLSNSQRDAWVCHAHCWWIPLCTKEILSSAELHNTTVPCNL